MADPRPRPGGDGGAVARSFAQLTLIPLGVPVMLAVFVVVLRRAEPGAMPDACREDSSIGGDSVTMLAGPGGTSRGQDFMRPWLHTAMASYGHDIAAMKS